MSLNLVPVNTSILLPAPDPDEESLTESENEGSDDDYGPDFTQEDVDGVYRDWLVAMDREDIKLMAIMLHDNLVLALLKQLLPVKLLYSWV